MDAISLLKDDHDKVKKLLAEGEETTERAEKGRTELFAKLKEEMLIHERIEEEIFYPALKNHPKAKELVLEAYEEHHVVDEIMGELEETDPVDEQWAAKFTVMKENIEHHIEEEEGEMFKQARQVFDTDELEALGARMNELKHESRTDSLTLLGNRRLPPAPFVERLNRGVRVFRRTPLRHGVSFRSPARRDAQDHAHRIRAVDFGRVRRPAGRAPALHWPHAAWPGRRPRAAPRRRCRLSARCAPGRVRSPSSGA